MYRTGDLLVRAGLVSFPALAEALGACTLGAFEPLAHQWRVTALENEALLCQTLATLIPSHPVLITSESTIDITLLDSIPQSHARQELFLPAQLHEGHLAVLVAQPEQTVRMSLPEIWRNYEIQSYVVVDSILTRLIDDAYRARGEGSALWIGARSQKSESPHLVSSKPPRASLSDLDSLLGAFVATVAEVPVAQKSVAAKTDSRRVLARIALEKRRARDIPS